MLKNNFEVDVKVKCIEAETTQAKLAEDIGTTPSYVNRLIKKSESIVNKTFVQMLESLGYDIELTYEHNPSNISNVGMLKWSITLSKQRTVIFFALI